MTHSERLHLVMTKSAVKTRFGQIFDNKKRYLNAVAKSDHEMADLYRSFHKDPPKPFIPKNLYGFNNAIDIAYLRKGIPNRREVIAHESFHQTPYLGGSETLARFYGGWKAPRNARIGARSSSGLKSVTEYLQPHMAKTYPARDLHVLGPILRKFYKPTPSNNQSPP